MTIRSTFTTSTCLAAMLIASLAFLGTVSSAGAESGFRSFQPRHPPIARIPTGPDKPLKPCLVLPHIPCGFHPGGH